jgi:hypothetical protein
LRVVEHANLSSGFSRNLCSKGDAGKAGQEPGEHRPKGGK